MIIMMKMIINDSNVNVIIWNNNINDNDNEIIMKLMVIILMKWY